MTKNKKIGLALGSGGVKGLAHIGVMEMLLKNNIPIDYIAGTSIGAWMGAHFCLYRDIEKLKEISIGYKKEKLISFLEPTIKGGLVRGGKVNKLLSNYLEHKNFSDLKIPLTIVTADLVSGEEIDISRGGLVPAVQASMAIPFVYKPIEYGGKILVDGGIINPVPDNIVKKMGADIIIAVNLDNQSTIKANILKQSSLTKVGIRSLNIIRCNLANNSIKDADIVIEPEFRYSGISSWRKFFMEKIDQEIINNGRLEAEKMLPKIKRLINAK